MSGDARVQTIREVLQRHNGEHLVWEAASALAALAAENEQLREKNEKLSKLIVEQEADYRERNRRLEAALRAIGYNVAGKFGGVHVPDPVQKFALVALDAEEHSNG